MDFNRRDTLNRLICGHVTSYFLLKKREVDSNLKKIQNFFNVHFLGTNCSLDAQPILQPKPW